MEDHAIIYHKQKILNRYANRSKLKENSTHSNDKRSLDVLTSTVNIKIKPKYIVQESNIKYLSIKITKTRRNDRHKR